jgi:hypothetical protein
MKVFAIYHDKKLQFIGIGESYDDCWRIFLGWPSEEEIKNAKNNGYYCVEVKVTPIDE